METTTPIAPETTRQQVDSKSINMDRLNEALRVYDPAYSDAVIKDGSIGMLNQIDCPLHHHVIDIWYWGGYLEVEKLRAITKLQCNCSKDYTELMALAEKQMLSDELIVCQKAYGLTEFGRNRLKTMMPPYHVAKGLLEEECPLVHKEYVLPMVEEWFYTPPSAKVQAVQEIPDQYPGLCIKCTKMRANYVRLNRPLERFNKPCGH
jgi:hypothetical protein